MLYQIQSQNIFEMSQTMKISTSNLSVLNKLSRNNRHRSSALSYFLINLFFNVSKHEPNILRAEREMLECVIMCDCLV